MTTTCPCCGAPVTDAYVDQRCARKLAQTLREAAGHAEDAWTVIAGLTRYGPRARGGGGETATPNLKASTDYGKASNTIGEWAQRTLDQTNAPEPEPWRPTAGPPCRPRRPADGPPAPGKPWLLCDHPSCATIRQPRPSATAEACTWLAEQVEHLRKHPEAGRAFRELTAACAQLEHLVDKPPTGRRLVGMCDCGQILYAPADRAVVQCKGRPRSCGATWDVERSQDILMDHLDQQLVTAAEAAHLAGWLDTDRTQEQIRKLVNKWAVRGQLAAHGHIWRDPTPAELDADPEAGPVAMPRFRFGEIRARIAATPRRQPAGAAA